SGPAAARAGASAGSGATVAWRLKARPPRAAGLTRARSPDASRGQLDHAGRVLLRHERGARPDDLAAARDGAGLEVLDHRDDAEVALEVRLLVDREQDVAGRDRLEDLRVQVERAERDAAELPGLPQRVQRRDRAA